MTYIHVSGQIRLLLLYLANIPVERVGDDDGSNSTDEVTVVGNENALYLAECLELSRTLQRGLLLWHQRAVPNDTYLAHNSQPTKVRLRIKSILARQIKIPTTSLIFKTVKIVESNLFK
jgi:hypothetical protein